MPEPVVTRAPAHEVVLPELPSDHLLIDLTRARSASVTLDDVALRAVEIVGSAGPDTVSGTVRGRETLYGTGGADRLEPGGTPNLAVGGAGDDTFVIDPGVKSVVRGGAGQRHARLLALPARGHGESGAPAPRLDRESDRNTRSPTG